MNQLDIVFLVLAGVFTLRGLLRGAIREGMSLVAVIVGLWAAAALNDRLAPLLDGLVASRGGRQALMFVAVFILVAFMGWLAARFLRKRVGSGGLGWLDYILGGAVGLAEGAVLCAVIMVILANFFIDFKFVRESVLGPRLLGGAAVVAGCLPDSATERMRECGIRLPAKDEETGREWKERMESFMDSLSGGESEPKTPPAEPGESKEL